MEVGCRVLRGPDWKWQNQDEGEGHLGTVVEIGKPGNNNTPDMTVVVQWDSGFRTNYRIGYQGSYDLRVYDNAPTGVRHPNIVCDHCKQQGVMGIRWKCAKCYDFDLCHLCYMSDKHDLTHTFIRFDTANSTGVKVVKRASLCKLRAKGIFSGARVVRGPDWDWGNQDGGDGMVGTVEDIRGWDNESGRSVANVTWASGMTNVYRLGHKGKADLKYLESADGLYYYKDHLPVLGENVETSLAAMTHCLFKVGDKVRVGLDVEVLKAMQDGHGGWNPRMAEYIGKVGSVHRITDKGDVRVQFEGCTNRWTFHAGALTKVQQYAVGDYVKVSGDIQKVKDAQRGHGEWTDNMKNALGKTGRVLKVYADGDLRITVGGNTWTFNPLCCIPISYGQQLQDTNNTMASTQDERQDHTKLLVETTTGASGVSGVTGAVDPEKQLVKEAAQGHLEVVSAVLTKYPDKVDQKSSGKTALHVASHQGHVDIVRVLLAAKANIQIQDDDGDSALHYSAFGNQPDLTELLLEHEASINQVNSAGCTALHVAVNKQHVRCAKILLRYQCDVNIQDSYGDTALHDAIGKNNHDIIDHLINYPRTDFTLRNKRGFNPIHHAALKGNNYATEHILQKARQVVNSRKEDGFSSLHLAALNGHKDVVSTLISLGRADLEIQNNRQQTPLLLAVTQGHVKIMEYLVNKGSSVKAVDEEGNSPLHLALMRQTSTLPPSANSAVGRIQADLSGTDLESHAGLAMACYLLQNGADPFSKNQQNKSPLQLVSSDTVLEVLNRYILPHHLGATSSAGGAGRRITSAAAVAAAATPPPPPPQRQHTSRSASKSHSKSRSAQQQRPSHHHHHTSNNAPPPPYLQSPATHKSNSSKVAAVPATPHTNTASSRDVCMVCEEQAIVSFKPCGHQIACMDCCIKMKKCLKCKAEIKYKIGPDGKTIGKDPLSVEELQKRMQEMEDSVNCSICMERPKNVAFLCGHSACVTCAKPLQICHMCRKQITKKINLF